MSTLLKALPAVALFSCRSRRSPSQATPTIARRWSPSTSGVEKCKARDPAGIPVIEKALRDAKFSLQPRG